MAARDFGSCAVLVLKITTAEGCAQLTAISANRNPGRAQELEVALAICWAYNVPDSDFRKALNGRADSANILQNAALLSPKVAPLSLLPCHAAVLKVSDETQNDAIGPADCVIEYVLDSTTAKLGVSVKYQTSVSKNPTGRKFLTRDQVKQFKHRLASVIVPNYEKEMTGQWGPRNPCEDGHDNWYRKQSTVTTRFAGSDYACDDLGLPASREWLDRDAGIRFRKTRTNRHDLTLKVDVAPP